MGEHRGRLGGLDRRPSDSDLPTSATAETSASQVFSTSPGKRAALSTTQTAAERANAATSSYVGRRLANRPTDAPSGILAGQPAFASPTSFSAPAALLAARERAPSVLDTGTIDTGTIAAVLAALEPVDQTTSFADEVTAQMPVVTPEAAPSALPAPVTPGKRRATRSTRRRRPLLRALPSAPLLVGVAALAVSAGGALSAGSSTQLTAASPASTSQASALNGTGGVGTVGLTRGQVTSRDSARATLDAASGGTAVDPVEELNAQRNGTLNVLRGQAEKFAAVIKQNLWQAPLDSYRLTARFGQYGLWANYHTGLDFAAPSGTPIHAIANGVVTSASYDGSYGNKTVVTLDDGTELWYCHQTSFAVSVGDTVRGGETIGYVGSTGNVTGPHVHIEVRPGGGDPVDPYPAFVEHGVTP